MPHVTLTHWTHSRNLPSIMRHGLLAARAIGARKAVWACSMEHAEWAQDHVAARHGWDVADVICLIVRIPESRLCGHSTKGVHYTYRDIPPTDILCAYDLSAEEKTDAIAREDLPS